MQLQGFPIDCATQKKTLAFPNMCYHALETKLTSNFYSCVIGKPIDQGEWIMCTLLCERDTKISQSVARALRHRGVSDIQIAESAAVASRLLDTHQVSVAVVDFAGEKEAARLVRSLSARGAEVILYSHHQPEPDAFPDLHYIFVDKAVDIETLAHLAAAQRRLAQPRASSSSYAPPLAAILPE